MHNLAGSHLGGMGVELDFAIFAATRSAGMGAASLPENQPCQIPTRECLALLWTHLGSYIAWWRFRCCNSQRITRTPLNGCCCFVDCFAWHSARAMGFASYQF